MIKVSNFNLALKEKAIFGIFSVFSLTAILLSFFIFPSFVSESSYADPVPPAADPSISIVPAGGINLVMTPIAGSGGTFGTAIANVTVNTSNTTGYTFTMNTETTDTDLKNSKVDYTTHPDQKITNLTTTTTATDFPLNKWGYNVHKAGTYIKGAANTYVPVPNSGSSDADRQIEVTDAAGSNNYTFAYGVKANLNLPSGDYNTTLVFSATANPVPIMMQDFDYAACQALSTGDTVTMYDERDNEEYLIGKLADDNCWMLDNLRLDLTDSTILNSLTTTNTNVDSASLTSLKSGNRSAGARYASSGFEAWDSNHTTNQYNQAKANADYKNTTTTSYGAGSGKIGVYYNFCAASAGNYCYDKNAGVDDTSTLQDAQYDICPKNWRMPTSDSSGEYQALLTAYNNNQTATDSGSFQYNLSTPLSGLFYSGSANVQGIYGDFWSSTWYDAYDMGVLDVSASYVDLSYSNGRDTGFSVRCMVDPSLYKRVASMSKGTQTAADLQAAITVPTSADRTQDTSNSGVYEYNSSVFGTSSDAANTSTIYYYRGVLENTVGSYGSDGSAVTYPNYVKLGDTCWRIVRTTGSGGVKMIYNGSYSGGTTANSCANTQTNAQVTTQAFGLRGNSKQSTYWYRNINRVGYTFNDNSSIQDITTTTSVDTVFGSNANPALNNARSNIKTYIEDTWYPSALSSYTSILEASAGYCSDRTAYSDDTTSTTLSTIPPYATSSATMYFGAYGRNVNATNANKTPSLTCPRSTVNRYRYVANSTGVSNELKYPAALLTADEASFAGSGRSTATEGSSYHANSFLRSGSTFWLLSPYYRTSGGYAYEFYLYSDGGLSSTRVSNSVGVRPAISLKSGIIPASGTGTATDPWVVDAP